MFLKLLVGLIKLSGPRVLFIVPFWSSGSISSISNEHINALFLLYNDTDFYFRLIISIFLELCLFYIYFNLLWIIFSEYFKYLLFLLFIYSFLLFLNCDIFCFSLEFVSCINHCNLFIILFILLSIPMYVCSFLYYILSFTLRSLCCSFSNLLNRNAYFINFQLYFNNLRL